MKSIELLTSNFRFLVDLSYQGLFTCVQSIQFLYVYIYSLECMYIYFLVSTKNKGKLTFDIKVYKF